MTTTTIPAINWNQTDGCEHIAIGCPRCDSTKVEVVKTFTDKSTTRFVFKCRACDRHPINLTVRQNSRNEAVLDLS